MANSFFGELKRRNVYRVAAMYAVVAWVLLQVADVTFPIFQVPDWSYRLVVWLLLLGFPPALILAWIFDLTPRGVVRTPASSSRELERVRAHRKIDFAIIGVLVFALGLMLLRMQTGGPAPTDAGEVAGSDFWGRPAIAVIPFDNLSGDPEQEYFVDGISEELITRLSLWRGFPVIDGNSTAFYEGQAVDARQVSIELGARYVVEGSVRRDATRVRINARLIDAATGRNVWAEQYDREMNDILALQDEVTLAIVGAMYPELERFEGERALRKEVRNLDAWDWAQRAWWHFKRETLDDNTLAESSYERAIERDPRFATAVSGLALTQYQRIANGWTDAVDQSIEQLEQLAKSAVALDDRDPMAYHALGHAHALGGNRDDMIAAFQLSIDLNPNSALVYACAGEGIALAGKHDEAIAYLEKSMRLSPKDPAIWWVYHGLALAHFAAEQYEEAVSWSDRALQRKPDFGFAHRTLAASRAHLGQLTEARAALDEALELAPEFTLADGRRVLLTAEAGVRQRYLDGLREAGLAE